jgi:hypothetical protein
MWRNAACPSATGRARSPNVGAMNHGTVHSLQDRSQRRRDVGQWHVRSTELCATAARSASPNSASSWGAALILASNRCWALAQEDLSCVKGTRLGSAPPGWCSSASVIEPERSTEHPESPKTRVSNGSDGPIPSPRRGCQERERKSHPTTSYLFGAAPRTGRSASGTRGRSRPLGGEGAPRGVARILPPTG